MSDKKMKNDQAETKIESSTGQTGSEERTEDPIPFNDVFGSLTDEEIVITEIQMPKNICSTNIRILSDPKPEVIS